MMPHLKAWIRQHGSEMVSKNETLAVAALALFVGLLLGVNITMCLLRP